MPDCSPKRGSRSRIGEALTGGVLNLRRVSAAGLAGVLALCRAGRCAGAAAVAADTGSTRSNVEAQHLQAGASPHAPVLEHRRRRLPQSEDTLPTGAALHALTFRQCAAAYIKAHLSSIPARKLRRCAAAYIKAHREGWKNPKHAAQWQSTLEQYAGPVIGDCNRGLQDDFRADPQTSSSRGSRPPSAT
ncbi:phage integrase central domain-containing protein [Sphaerotilus sulfidivorans]